MTKSDFMKQLKVVDFHIHIGQKEHWHTWVHDYQKAAHTEYYERYEEMIDPDKFTAYLKSHDIEKTVILPEISPITTGFVSNEYVLDFCEGHDIFVPFCTINPTYTDNPAKEIKRYIEMGAQGVKLYPSYNYFFPNENLIYPVYALAEEHQIPVLVHTGTSVFKGTKNKYADPIYLDDVAADFPDLNLIMAHSGRGLWYEKAFFLSRLHSNLYLEISGLPPKNLLSYFPDMEKNINKFVYGSDWPGIKAININIEAIKKLPLAEESIRKILYGNAARILGLK